MFGAFFDTNILIGFSRGDELAQKAIRSYRERFISVITWMEFLVGVPESKQEQAKDFLADVFETIYPGDIVYDMALDLRRERGLKIPDALIYATARSKGLPLVTFDKKDFKEDWEDIIIPGRQGL